MCSRWLTWPPDTAYKYPNCGGESASRATLTKPGLVAGACCSPTTTSGSTEINFHSRFRGTFLLDLPPPPLSPFQTKLFFRFSHSEAMLPSDFWVMSREWLPQFFASGPHVSKCAHLLGESMMWRRLPETMALPTAAQAAHAFLPPHPSGSESEKRFCPVYCLQEHQRKELPQETMGLFLQYCESVKTDELRLYCFEDLVVF